MRSQMIVAHMLFGWISAAALLLSPATPCSAEQPGPWWQRETALTEDGKLLLTNRSWWPKAQALKAGEHFLVRSEQPGGGQMLMRRERQKICWTYGNRKPEEIDLIVWVIDDDGDWREGDTDGDRDNDCYVVDYGADATVDRMIDFMDNNGDGKPDEMDIRYFGDSQLRIAWFCVDLDRDGHMWKLANYEYTGNFFECDPYGNNVIYANRYDPDRKRWFPVSECPFAFYDADGDGQSEAVVRVSAAPLDFDPQTEPDPGNALFRYEEPFQPRLRTMGAANIRYSIDLDKGNSAERPLHYDLGFNLIGHLPYRFDKMERANPLRRPPNVTIVAPFEQLRHIAETYKAEQTGFSFREYEEDGLVLGYGPHASEDRRWEGIFWTWNRRVMHNTGGPVQNWNMRREFRPTPSTKRELYYSRVDRRIHLKGATEGWLCIGRLGSKDVLGEIRMADSDRDGYFDRWEVYRADRPQPVRISTVRDAAVRELPSDWEKLRQIYVQELLPEALQSNRRVLAALRAVDSAFQVPENLAGALAAASCDSERQYVQDVIREMHYLALRDRIQEQAAQMTAASETAPGEREPKRLASTSQAWQFTQLVTDLDIAYGEGRYDDVVRLLEPIRGYLSRRR